MNDQNSSNEAKTPLANVSDSKDIQLDANHPHVSRNPDIYGGAPIVSGIRFTVGNVLGYLATHHDIKSICETWNLTEDAVRDAIGFAQDVYNEAIYGREQPSTSGVFSNPERGTIARNETESASSISSTLVEITQRWEGNRPYAPPFEICQKDVLTLLGIIDSLKAEKEALRKEVTAWRNGEQEISAHDAASNMKAAILQRVREKAASLSVHHSYAETLNELATELESIQLKDGGATSHE